MWVDQENREDPYNRANPVSNTPTVGAGGGISSTPTASGTASNPSTQTPVQADQPTQNFGTVQDYLKGNQQQGEALGQQFTGNLANTQTNEKNAIDTAAKQTQSDINSGTTNYDSGLVNTAASDPTKVTSNPDQLSSFLKQWNAAYTGPSSFENSANYTPASTAASEAANLGTQEATTGGQQQILHDQFGVYGQGNQGLDQAVLQNSSYFPKVQEQAKQFGTVQDYLNKTAQPLNAAATTAATNTAATQANTRGAFANSLSDFQKNLTNRVDTAQTAATAANTQAQAALASGDPTKIAAALQNSGVDDATRKNITDYLTALNQDYQITPNLPASTFLNPGVDITSANVAMPEDYAKAQALQTLTGENYAGVLNPANAGQAGQAGTTQPIKANDLSGYLKQSLNLQDNSVLNSPNGLNTLLPDVSNATQGSQIATRTIDAVKRSTGNAGYGKNDINQLPPQLKSLLNQAIDSYGQLRDYLNRGQITLDSLTTQVNPQYAGAGQIINAIRNYMKGSN